MITKLKTRRFCRNFLDFYLKSRRMEEIAPRSSANPLFFNLKIRVKLPQEARRYEKPLKFHLPRITHLTHLETTILMPCMSSHLYTRKLTCLARVIVFNQIQTMEFYQVFHFALDLTSIPTILSLHYLTP